jgi:hypothetical protein
MALSEDQPTGAISAAGEVGLNKHEDLRGAEQSSHDAGVSPSRPVVDKPKTLRKLPMCPAPAMLIGVTYHCRQPAQAAFAGRLRL